MNFTRSRKIYALSYFQIDSFFIVPHVSFIKLLALQHLICHGVKPQGNDPIEPAHCCVLLGWSVGAPDIALARSALRQHEGRIGPIYRNLYHRHISREPSSGTVLGSKLPTIFYNHMVLYCRISTN